MASNIGYAKSGDHHIAFRTLGNGPVDLVLVSQWFSNVDMERDVAPFARFDDRLASFGRVILFDKRGVGLSDPVPMTAFPPIEEWMDDLRAERPSFWITVRTDDAAIAGRPPGLGPSGTDLGEPGAEE